MFIGQVLANTVDNALKYGGPDVPIHVSARRLGDGLVRATIEDGGPGVPPEAMPRLFEKFYRVPRQGEGSRRGTGIGLSVVQGLVEAHGWSRPARTEHLKAAWRSITTFARIQVLTDELAYRRPPNILSSRMTRPRDLEGDLLRGHGHDNRDVADPDGGTWPPGRHVAPTRHRLDLGLPGSRLGETVVRHVRREATTPVLILSARDREADKVTALDQGADDYVTKPFGDDELRVWIDVADPPVAAGRSQTSTGEIRVGELVLDVTRRLVTVGAIPVHLTPREYEVLKVLATHAGRLVTYGRLAAGRVGDGVRGRIALRARVRQPDPSQTPCGRSERVA